MKPRILMRIGKPPPGTSEVGEPDLRVLRGKGMPTG